MRELLVEAYQYLRVSCLLGSTLRQVTDSDIQQLQMLDTLQVEVGQIGWKVA
jgi:hypothetical protein